MSRQYITAFVAVAAVLAAVTVSAQHPRSITIVEIIGSADDAVFGDAAPGSDVEVAAPVSSSLPIGHLLLCTASGLVAVTTLA